MSTDILVPTLGESVTEATVAQWLKKPGDAVARDEPVVALETDKVTLEVNAAEAGVLAEILIPEGENVAVGAVLGQIGEGNGAASAENGGGDTKAPASDAPASEAAAADDEPAPVSGGEATPIVVPTLGESVAEATVARWLKASGDAVEADEALVELETDKVTLEVNAPAAGVLGDIAAEAGATVEVGATLGTLLAGASGGAKAAAPKDAPATAAAEKAEPAAAPAAAKGAVAEPLARANPASAKRHDGKITGSDLAAFLEDASLGHLGPAVRNLIAEHDLDTGVIPA
ncbi:MAG TPA: biotin/lipoyl-containing protein, partial [Kiloniellaceae bacterium]|nr:biotin/lipoyl-containing protein [Kiloniellaceae bacterium]